MATINGTYANSSISNGTHTKGNNTNGTYKNGTHTDGVASQRPSEHSDIPWLTPYDEGFASKREIYSLDHNATPSAIVCPQSAKDVGRLVRYAVSHRLDFTIRSGGHNVQGAAIADGALCIDMRALNSVNVAADRKTAKVGGGVIVNKLLADLEAEGLLTPVGTIDSVGYVGWATWGGLGAFNDHFGFGVDQIVGATVVNGKGDVVEADDAMLWAIRGGSGNMGVIVDMTIKVYEVPKIFAGALILDTSAGLANTFVKFSSGLQRLRDEGLPSEVAIEPVVVSVPKQGPSIIVSFVWSSTDVTAGKAFLEKVQALAPVAVNTVGEVSVPDWAGGVSSTWPYGQWGTVLAVNVTSMSPNVHEAMTKIVKDAPLEAGARILVHEVGHASPGITDDSLRQASAFNPALRQQHVMIEMIGNTLDKSKKGEVEAWAKDGYRALRGCEEAYRYGHAALVAPEDQTPENAFGPNLARMREMKRAYDPNGVFSSALPKIF